MQLLLEAARSVRKVWSVRERQHYIDQGSDPFDHGSNWPQPFIAAGA